MKKIKILLISLSVLITSTVFALEPWFTGPILAPAGKNIPKGHWNFEPYAFYTDNFGVYDNHRKIVKVPNTHTVNINPLIFYGITDLIDVQGSFPLFYNVKNGQRDYSIGDFSVLFGYQAVIGQEGTWTPDVRFTLSVNFPTGKYQNLNPGKQGVDGMGAGSYQTSLGLNFQKMVELSNSHYLRSRLTFAYTLTPSTNVQGFNVYGGGIATNGRLDPGDQFQTDFALEYQLTQNWVPVFEVNYTTRAKSKFTGMSGFNPNGTLAMVGHGKIDQLSFAPALEYNVSERLGIIGGVWFSALGRNANDFASGVVAVNYYM